jgi:hypothetical protein
MPYQHNRPRKHLFVDPKVQRALIVRAVLYMFVCLITISVTSLCWTMITEPSRMLYHDFDSLWVCCRPALVAMLLLLPIFIIDMVQLSNCFVGPLLRLRQSMRALARGENVDPLEFRDADFWQESANEFNAVRARMKSLEEARHVEHGALEEFTASR